MPDGDYKFLLKLDKEYKSLLNKDNKKKTGGNLVVEIVPKDWKILNILNYLIKETRQKYGELGL